MTGIPAHQNSFEGHIRKLLSRRDNIGMAVVVDSLASYGGTIGSGLLIEVMEALDQSDRTRDVLKNIVSKSRATDCAASVRAAEMLLETKDIGGADEILSMSEGSQEHIVRQVMKARIHLAQGDRRGATEAAKIAYYNDPTYMGSYDVLMVSDPDGGWQQRRNIQDIINGDKPRCPPGRGRLQELYAIYYDWFSGRHDSATEALVGSKNYKDKDPEFVLASARMSMDETDWSSALMVYSELIRSNPKPFIFIEAAEAALGVGDHTRALDYLSKADVHTMRAKSDAVKAYTLAGDNRGMMGAVRILLDDENCESDEYVNAVRLLLSKGMERDALDILDRYTAMTGEDSNTLIIRSVMLMRSGDYPAARRYATKAVRKDSDSGIARAQLARVLYHMNQPAKAERECSAVLSKNPDDLDVLTLIRDQQMFRKEYDNAAVTCRRILDVDPRDVTTMIVLATATARTGDTISATTTFKHALRSDSSQPTAIRILTSMLSCGLNREVDSMCEPLEDQFENDPMLRRVRGNARYALGNYLGASASYADAVSMDPGNPALWYSKGMADEARGDMGSAMDAFDRAVLLDHDEPEYWISKASVHEITGDINGAIGALNYAISLSPGSYKPLVKKAGVLMSQSKWEDALQCIKVAERMSDDVRIMDMKADALIGLKDPSAKHVLMKRISRERTEQAYIRLAEFVMAVDGTEAVEEVKKEALEAFPDSYILKRELDSISRGIERRSEKKALRQVNAEGDIGTLGRMSESLMIAGDLWAAIRTVDSALALEPDDPDLYCLKARIVLAQGDYEGAAFLSNLALKNNPKHGGLHRVNALAREAKGDLRGAVAEIDKAIACGVDDVDSYVIKGRMQMARGEHAQAAKTFSKAMALDKNNIDIANDQVQEQFLSGDYKGTVATATWILKRERRPSVMLLMAKAGKMLKDHSVILSAYEDMSICRNIPDDIREEMIALMAETGHKTESASLCERSAPKYEDATKAMAAKVLRKAYTMHTSADDPDILGALGLDRETARKVTEYITDIKQCELPASDTGLERQSHDIIMGLKWTDLENNPVLPLEKVFVEGGFRDVDSAKAVVAYVSSVMNASPGKPNDRLTTLAMRLISSMTIYEIMRQCDLGVYEARIVKKMIF